LASKAIKFGEKNPQNKGYYVIQGHQGWHQSKVHMQLPVTILTSYLVPFRSCRSSCIFWTLCFWAPFGGFGTT